MTAQGLAAMGATATGSRRRPHWAGVGGRAPDPMNTTDAQWVREHVWPAWMRAMDADYGARGCFIMRMCACDLRVCVPCSKAEPRHDLCLTRQHNGRPLGWDVRLFGAACCEVVSHAHGLATVTQVGYPCRWQCPCGCWRVELPKPKPKRKPKPKPKPMPAKAPQRRQVVTVGQLDLFANVGA